MKTTTKKKTTKKKATVSILTGVRKSKAHRLAISKGMRKYFRRQRRERS